MTLLIVTFTNGQGQTVRVQRSGFYLSCTKRKFPCGLCKTKTIHVLPSFTINDKIYANLDFVVPKENVGLEVIDGFINDIRITS